jgi:hypothetical protein
MEHSIIKGKYAEVKVFKHLLDKRYEVYIPIVDTGVDFIVEPPEPLEHKFIGIQVKLSKYQPSAWWWEWSVSRDMRREKSAFFYVLCFDDLDKLPKYMQDKVENNLLCYVVPYSVLDTEISKTSRAWTRNGYFSLTINRQSFETRKSKWVLFLEPYVNNWSILK